MLNYIFRCWLSLGDIVLLTAAIRDLQLTFPGRYVVDVRTWYPDLWRHNPRLTPLGDYDPEVKVVDCVPSLVNRSDTVGCHSVYVFIDFLNQYLGTRMKPAAMRGDIYLSDQEKARRSQVHELVGAGIPFWLISAGGKHDCTIKWWDVRRYQEVVDHFRGHIQFVQVGDGAHYHPRLRGVIDLRGRTTIRELILLVHHAQGVLCGVTGLMHLAAAVPLRSDRHTVRPCVVVAGGREPPHWEAYPGHQFIHTVGALACCAHGGCWKARTTPLGDGDERDAKKHLCVDVKQGLPRCMDMISSDAVIQRIETYFGGGTARYLSPKEAKLAAGGVGSTASNTLAKRPLNFYTAPELAERFINEIPACPPGFTGRGIVVCGGGVPMFTNAWVCINMLRRLGCDLPIELWHCGECEMDDRMRALVAPLGVKCVDVETVRCQHPANLTHVWAVKPYALLHSRFQQVLLLDADNVPVQNPEHLFDAPEFLRLGAVFWPDYWRLRRGSTAWKLFDVPCQSGPEFETGQVLVDKKNCWRPLNLCLWYNQHSELFYQHVHGDKQTFQMAFFRLNTPYAMPSRKPHRLPGVMCQHDLEGHRLFQHRTMAKWSLFAPNRRIRGFRFDKECRQILCDLRRVWDGQIEKLKPRPLPHPADAGGSAPAEDEVKLFSCVVSSPERGVSLQKTLANLAATDWAGRPVHVQMDEQRFTRLPDRLAHTAWKALQIGLQSGADYLLYLEDNLEFNAHFFQNLCAWSLLARKQITLASLHNPGIREFARIPSNNAIVIDPRDLVGAQALLISRQAAQLFCDNWREGPEQVGPKMGLLATRLQYPVFCHSPSLVRLSVQRRAPRQGFPQARDFQAKWAAPEPAAQRLSVISRPAPNPRDD
ncbi:MAG TPA: glycosyltransferase family 9 protein [Verrucomicrobiae bacterium]